VLALSDIKAPLRLRVVLELGKYVQYSPVAKVFVMDAKRTATERPANIKNGDFTTTT
jgi:hypothetical protein